MRILFVLSQVEVTGAETYALALAKALKGLGQEVIFVSEKLKDTGGFPFHSLPLHSRNTSTWGRIKNVMALKTIIEEEKIDLLHCHSRAANLVTHFAKKKRPMVVTVHGRWRNHFAARVLPALGERTIAVCPYLERYLASDIGVPKDRISMIPNGIDTEKFAPQAVERKGPPEILFVGRFSGQKGNVIRFLLRGPLNEVVRAVPGVTVKIVSFNAPEKDHQRVQLFNKGFNREVVRIVETEGSTVPIYNQAAIVVGSGRVAMEAMACGRPVYSIGESSAPGLLLPENFDGAFDSNFGDCGEWNLFEKDASIGKKLIAALADSKALEELGRWGRTVILDRFDANKVAKQVEEVYRKCL